ncbi:hypothetical protein Hanom_Chr14g01336911 [Helianthus anomalus]
MKFLVFPSISDPVNPFQASLSIYNVLQPYQMARWVTGEYETHFKIRNIPDRYFESVNEVWKRVCGVMT